MNDAALALLLVLASHALAASSKTGIPLRAAPARLEPGRPQAVRLFVLFDDIPPSEAPAMMYGAAGEVYRLGPSGAKTKVADLSHRLDMKSPAGAEAAGLEASVVVKPKAGEKLAFIARIRNRDGWSRWTERLEVFAQPPPRPPAAEPEGDASGIGERDYAALRKACRGASCCLASVGAMERGGWALSRSGECPAGYRMDMLRCITTYRWCALSSPEKM